MWTGSVNSNGQPIVGWKGETFKARRVIVALYEGKIKDSQVVTMACGEKLCVNPEHMEVRNVSRALTLKDFELEAKIPMGTLPQDYKES